VGRVRFLTLLAVLGLCALPGSALASRPLPRGFVGVMVDGPTLFPHVDLSQQVTKMADSGVESLRVAFSWSFAQPYRHWSDVPHAELPRFTRIPGGVPTDFRATDRLVAQAAVNHLLLLPVVTYAPPWAALKKGNHIQPAHTEPYAHYLTALVDRYGPHGTFWTLRPKLPKWPVTSWEIWNEPNLSANWDTFPFAHSYVALLRAAHRVIKHADPSARIVLAAMTNYGEQALASIYKIKGSSSLFDAVAVNAYTTEPKGVITILKHFRKVMDAHGNHGKPLLATELGWPSAVGKTDVDFGINTTQQGQARKLSKLLPLLASNRRALGLAGFYYYNWMSVGAPNINPFAYSGLLRFNRTNGRVKAKPAYYAFRRTALKLEGCPHGTAGAKGCRTG
jgi:hypothetical protein